MLQMMVEELEAMTLGVIYQAVHQGKKFYLLHDLLNLCKFTYQETFKLQASAVMFYTDYSDKFKSLIYFN